MTYTSGSTGAAKGVCLTLDAMESVARSIALATSVGQPRGHIVNIGSVFGAIGYPGHAAYCATKFALRGFSEALRRELGNTNVRVHYLAPGLRARNSTATL